MKQCKIYGNKEGKEFKIKFDFSNNEDYIERLDSELTKNSCMLEDCIRIYIQEIKG